MNRPSPFAYLIGNPLSVIGLISATAYMLYQWWTKTDTSSSLPPIVAFFVVSMTLNAGRQVAAYRTWKKEWDAMSGEPPPRQYPKGLEPWRLISVTAIAGVCGAVLWDDSIGSSDTREVVAWLFGISVLALTVGVIRLANRSPLFAKKAGYAGKNHVVKQCLPVPGRSVHPRKALAQVPPYCRELIEASRASGGRP